MEQKVNLLEPEPEVSMPKTIEKKAPSPMLRESANQIWLAGLGALSLAEDEGGKFFKALVKRGKALETDMKDRVDEVRGKLDARKATGETLVRIETGFENGVAGVMHRLGLPTKKEIDGLAKRVDRLTKAIEAKPVHHTAKKAIHHHADVTPA